MILYLRFSEWDIVPLILCLEQKARRKVAISSIIANFRIEDAATARAFVNALCADYCTSSQSSQRDGKQL